MGNDSAAPVGVSDVEVLRAAAQVIRDHQHPHLIDDWNVVSRANNVGLKHIRYTYDTQGRNVWWRRAFRAFNPRRHMKVYRSVGDKVAAAVGSRKGGRYTANPFKWGWRDYWAQICVHLPKDDNVPDAVLHGGSIISYWVEHAVHAGLWTVEVAELVAVMFEDAADSGVFTSVMVDAAQHIVDNPVRFVDD